jgi:tRNA (uracil-5-)-methyltransferase
MGTILWLSLVVDHSLPVLTNLVFARQVVAVEINKLLCQAAEYNLSANQIGNVAIIPCDSGRFARNILRNKCYRTKQGEEYKFGGVLVDPPRAGLDPLTRTLVRNYDEIIYISCNPEALASDLTEVRFEPLIHSSLSLH